MAKRPSYQHPIRFIHDKCKGCTHCLRACPTGAIRVRNGKAQIIEDKCIACGECIRVCPNGAITTNSDNLDRIEEYEHKIAIPTSPFFGQSSEEISTGTIVQALLEIGFDEVYEEAIGSEALVYGIREEIEKNNSNENKNGPLISTACPAIIRFIQVKYPSLTDNLVPLSSPSEVTAEIILREKENIPKDKIGIFSIAPCPAQVTAGRAPVGREESALDGIISIEEVYNKIMGIIPKIKKKNYDEQKLRTTKKGINWGRREGEIEAINKNYRIIAVDGIRAVNRILTDLEEGRLNEVEYVEVRSCVEGCAGGVLTSEDPPITKYRLQNMNENQLADSSYKDKETRKMYEEGMFNLENKVEPRPTLHLHDDLQKAISIMEKAEQVMKILPGLDCAACGSPNCQAFAEDVAKGEIDISKCPLLDDEEIEEE